MIQAIKPPISQGITFKMLNFPDAINLTNSANKPNTAEKANPIQTVIGLEISISCRSIKNVRIQEIAP